jgi:hypothetical protein
VEPRGLLSAVVEFGVVVLLAVVLPVLAGRVVVRLRGRILPPGPLRAGLAGAALVGVVAGSLVVSNGPPVVVDRPASNQALCTETAFRFCVWPESAVHLPVLESMAERAESVAGSLAVAPPDAMYELGLDPDASTFTMVNSTTWFVSGTVASVIAWRVEPAACELDLESSAGEQAYETRQELAAMIQLMLEDSVRPLGMGDTSDRDWAAIEAVWQDGDGAVEAWLEGRVGQVRALNAEACG